MRNKSNLSFLIVVFALSLAFVASAFAQDDTADKNEIQAPQAPASSLFVDNFNFSGALTTSGWTEHSPGTGTNPIVTTTGLTYAGYPGSGVGNAALVTNAGGQDVNQALSTPQNTNGAVVYFSCLVNVNDAATAKTGDYFIHIGTRVSPTSFSSFAARVYARIVGGSVNFGLSNTNVGVYGPTNFNRNQTYLLIVKYTINTGGNDSTSLWVFPSGVPANEGAAGTPELTETTTTGQDVIDAIALRQGSATNSAQAVVDGIRAGTVWADVTSTATVQHAADYNGDGKTDFGVVRQGAGGNSGQLAWFIKINGGVAEVRRDWGLNSDVLAPADYDGDGSTDIAIWRQLPSPPAFYILRSSDNTFTVTQFGTSGDIPIPADFTGDGKADPAVYRASAISTFWYKPSSGPFFGTPVAVPWGSLTDIPAPGDYNGDGKADFCYVRAVNGLDAFNIRFGTDSTAAGPADTVTYFGRSATDSVVSGDFNGDGSSDIAVTRPEGGQIVWYYLPSGGGAFQRIVWGLSASDFQVPGDYDGDGKTDVAVWRGSGSPGVSAFYVLGTLSGFLFQQYGNANTDTPVNFDVLQ